MTDAPVSFLDHLDEMRSRVIKSLAAIAIGTLVAFFINDQILNILVFPYEVALPGTDLAYFRPTEAFSLVMRISLFAGVILASPVILYQSWRFLAPALTSREKKE